MEYIVNTFEQLIDTCESEKKTIYEVATASEVFMGEYTK